MGSEIWTVLRNQYLKLRNICWNYPKYLNFITQKHLD